MVVQPRDREPQPSPLDGSPPPDIDRLTRDVRCARARLLEMIADLSDAELETPMLPTINPLLWEVCHAAYFQELWVLREGAGQEPGLANADELFDSATICHEHRWRLPMPTRDRAMEYVRGVEARVLELLESGRADPRTLYYVQYSIAHEDMHAESLTYARQILALPAPELGVERCAAPDVPGRATGDEEFDAATIEIGARPGVDFCLDNEKWAHEVQCGPFAMARAAVSEGDFAAFVDDGGYRRPELWTPVGWRFVQGVQAELPMYWRRASDGELERRSFDRWIPIEAERAMQHVSWYEADAYARWAGRRLPTELEWERAAQRCADEPYARLGNLDWRHGDAVSVHAVGPDSPAGSEAGCRQLVGNVWEWTASPFEPFGGFAPDMYRDYSLASFRTRMVLRGGAWTTRARFLRPTLRNFYQPTRRDVYAGLRTCALG